MKAQGKSNRFKSSLRWVPNLFTLGNLTMGFIAVLISAREGSEVGSLGLSCGLILLASLCDGLDGFAARLLNAESELGAQLDTLADLTAFGIAPAVVMYSFVLREVNPVVQGVVFPLGMVIAAIYPACAAYRLARFNVAHDPSSFVGLPSPVSGVIVALMPLAFTGPVRLPPLLLIAVFILVAYLMVSTIRYSKPQMTLFKRFNPTRLWILISFIVIALICVGFLRGFTYTAFLLFLIIMIYIVTGLTSLVLHWIVNRRNRD